MTDLHKALGDIGSIRRQVAASTEFRGYGSATVAATGVMVLAAAALQARLVPDPAHHLYAYLGLWMTTAVLSAVLIAVQMYTRTRRIHSGLSDEMLRMASVQFLPALVAGLLLTAVVARSAPGVVWVLPGMWQLVSSLGLFSSCRFLPRPMLAAGAWYMLAGLALLSLGGAGALAPWTMGLGYGAGQLLIAGILFVTNRSEGEDHGC